MLVDKEDENVTTVVMVGMWCREEVNFDWERKV